MKRRKSKCESTINDIYYRESTFGIDARNANIKTICDEKEKFDSEHILWNTYDPLNSSSYRLKTNEW